MSQSGQQILHLLCAKNALQGPYKKEWVSSSFFPVDILGNCTLMVKPMNGMERIKWDHKGKLLPVLCRKIGMLLLQMNMNCCWCKDHFLGAVGWKKIFKNSTFHGKRTTQSTFWLIQIIHRVTLLRSRLFMDFQGIAPVWRYQAIVGACALNEQAARGMEARAHTYISEPLKYCVRFYKVMDQSAVLSQYTGQLSGQQKRCSTIQWLACSKFLETFAPRSGTL